jgi:hypothetical protein
VQPNVAWTHIACDRTRAILQPKERSTGVA